MNQQPRETRTTNAEPRLRWITAALTLAAAHGLWSVFQWSQLIVARRGGEPFCALGQSGACSALWDSAFARGVASLTGVPLAGWGVAWSLTALGLPLWAGLRLRRAAAWEPFWSATLLTAAGGVAGVLGLAGVSASQGILCTNCTITYLLVLSYAFVCAAGSRHLKPTRLARGAGVSLTAVALAYALLLYPGLETPRAAAGLASFKRTPEQAPFESLEEVRERLAKLPEEERQQLSDARARYLGLDPPPAHRPRALIGSADAPVRITEFSDVLCGHCANMHRTFELLQAIVPPGWFALELRQFPLHADCNPYADESAGGAVRCTAARVRICVESHPNAFALDSQLFARQRKLDEALLYDLAQELMPRAKLEACVRSAETQASLEDDIAWAAEHRIAGTPLILVNGRKASAFPSFLYALVMTQGDASHALFDGLPPPRVSLPSARSERR